jgi:hypothetical protein
MNDYMHSVLNVFIFAEYNTTKATPTRLETLAEEMPEEWAHCVISLMSEMIAVMVVRGKEFH